MLIFNNPEILSKCIKICRDEGSITLLNMLFVVFYVVSGIKANNYTVNKFVGKVSLNINI